MLSGTFIGDNGVVARIRLDGNTYDVDQSTIQKASGSAIRRYFEALTDTGGQFPSAGSVGWKLGAPEVDDE